jgi:hypothetical protein
MANPTSKPDSVNIRPSDNGDGDAREPDGPVDTSFDPAALEAPEPPDPGPDPYDPAALRLTEDFAATIGVKRAILSIPVRKPDKAWFVRTHPGADYRLQTAVIELKEDRGETYLVSPALWPELATEATFSPRALFTAINRQGVLFVWPVRLPGSDGRVDEWSRTALESAQRAADKWSRVVANMSLGAYELFEANGQLPEPEWPDLTFQQILRTAFKDRFIAAPDHAVLRKLRGEV